jgi:amino acid transporter
VAANHTVSEWAERGIAIGVIIFVTLIHSLVPKWGVRLMNLLTGVKLVILVFIVITGWVVLSGRVHSIPDPHKNFRNGFAGSVHASNPYATALFKVLNSYAGYVHIFTNLIKGAIKLTLC